MSITYKTPFDTRVVEYHLRKGTVSHDDYSTFLGDLPDEAEECEETETHFVPAYEMRNYGSAEEVATDTDDA